MIRSSKVALCIITIAGAILRLATLTKESFWFDEGATVSFALKSFSEIGNVVSSGEFNPPLFYWLEHIVVMAAGVSELSMRFIPAVAGILAIPAIYYLGKEISDDWLGLGAAALLAVSSWHIMYSQEARGYTLTILFFVCALTYFIRLIKRRDLCIGVNPCGFPTTSYRDEWAQPPGSCYYKSSEWAFMFGLFGALCIWTHFFSAIFILPLVIIGIVKRWKTRDTAFYELLIPVIASMPLAIPFYTLSSEYVESAASIKVASAAGLVGIQVIETTFYDLVGLAAGFVLVAIPVGLYYLYKKDKFSTLTLAAMVIVPLIAALLLSDKIVLGSRYFAPMLPVLLILTSALAMTLKDSAKHPVFAVAVIGVIVMMCVPQIAILMTNPEKPLWRETAEYISHQNVTDIVLISGHFSWHPFKIYYKNATYHSVQNIYQLENTSALRSNTTDYIVLDGEMTYMDDDHKMALWLEQKTNFEVNYAGVKVYTKK
jgi:mannosyltransferase